MTWTRTEDWTRMTEPTLKSWLEGAKATATIGLHISVGVDMAVAILRRRMEAHGALKQETVAVAMGAAIEELVEESRQLRAEADAAKACVEAIQAEVTRRGEEEADEDARRVDEHVRQHPELYECESCSRKPGSPTLCDRCLTERSNAGNAWVGPLPRK